jgi:hypothetical protein
MFFPPLHGGRTIFCCGSITMQTLYNLILPVSPSTLLRLKFMAKLAFDGQFSRLGPYFSLPDSGVSHDACILQHVIADLCV